MKFLFSERNVEPPPKRKPIVFKKPATRKSVMRKNILPSNNNHHHGNHGDHDNGYSDNNTTDTEAHETTPSNGHGDVDTSTQTSPQKIPEVETPKTPVTISKIPSIANNSPKTPVMKTSTPKFPSSKSSNHRPVISKPRGSPIPINQSGARNRFSGNNLQMLSHLNR